MGDRGEEFCAEGGIEGGQIAFGRDALLPQVVAQRQGAHLPHQVLELAAESRILKVGNLTVAIDGTNPLVNASKHGAMSHDHLEKELKVAEALIGEMLAKAEEAVPPALPEGATMSEVMAHLLETKAGKKFYALCKQTVEPVFGIIKEAMASGASRCADASKWSSNEPW